MGLLLRGLGGAVRAVEVRLDDLEHADDAVRALLLALIGALEARARGVLVHGGGLQQDFGLGGLLVEHLQDLQSLVDRLEALPRLLHGVQVLLVLPLAQLRGLIQVLGELLDGVLEHLDLLLELDEFRLERLDLDVQALRVPHPVVAVLVGHAELLIAKTLLRGLRGGLSNQTLDELLDQGLDLEEWVRRQVRRQLGQRRAAQALALLLQHRDDLVVERLRCQRRSAAEQRGGPAAGAPPREGLLDEGHGGNGGSAAGRGRVLRDGLEAGLFLLGSHHLRRVAGVGDSRGVLLQKEGPLVD
mmetsp:Transcript_16972/g.42675  ORF Transcript_16972/g.42675 Transcript_16972/m.42675 type:complete len:301 (+) Transcript_16972:393-1295(+)